MSHAVDPAWIAAHPEACTVKTRLTGVSRTRGFAGRPGAGPAGETCRSCRHYAHNHGYEGRSKGYPKCWLMRAIWTNGPGTDIRAGSAACEKWEAKLGKKTLQEIADEEMWEKQKATLKANARHLT